MNQIKDDFPNYKYICIDNFELDDYKRAVMRCIDDNTIIIYYIINKKNPLIKKMITGGFIADESELMLFHGENYVHIPKGEYDKRWFSKCLGVK